MLEHVVVNRLVRHLSRDGMDLHQDQYGFCERRSTLTQFCEGRVALAVSLDIRNALNTLPWNRVKEAANGFGLLPSCVPILHPGAPRHSENVDSFQMLLPDSQVKCSNCYSIHSREYKSHPALQAG
ncbi:hypothetical protein ACFW04_004631 [Cataglyphis niger]